MRTVLVTGSDTGVGKTHVVATLARLLGARGTRVQIVKVVETGCDAVAGREGDAACARRLSGSDAVAFTLASFPAPLAPAAAAALADRPLALEALVAQTR